jgi:8-oxo-dGTP pyrophosphatase MutT (NUDIX family)
MKQEKSAGAVIYYYESEAGEPKFLLLQNTLKTTYWEFPKGKIEENEKIEETVRREVSEETGLREFEIIQGFEHTLHWFFKFKGELINKEAVYLLIRLRKEDKDKVKINHEHQEFKWMYLVQAKKEVKIKANLELLKKAHEFILEFEKQKRLF